MIYGSVCSGIEAASVAWHPLGWRPAFLSEIDAFPRAVLKHHYPEVPLHGDFTTIQAGQYEPIELLVGGTPCQSFSVAGLRGGLADDRGNLALEFLRLAQRLGPRWLVWENVPGVLSSNGGRDFGAILGGMVELGYGIAYRVLDAQFFGVPQRRRRVFVVGHLGDWRRAAAVLFERESLSGNPPPRREAGQGVAPTISARTKGGGGLGTDFDCDGGLIYAPGKQHAIAKPLGLGEDGELARALNACHTASGRHDVSVDTFVAAMARPVECYRSTGNKGIYSTGDTTEALTCTNDPNHHVLLGDAARPHAIAFDTTQITHPENRSNPQPGDPCHPQAAQGHPPAIAFQSRIARNGRGQPEEIVPAVNGSNAGATSDMRPLVAYETGGVTEFLPQSSRVYLEDGIAPTVQATGKRNGNRAPQVQQAMAVRRLTPRECERLQGFPDDWTSIPTWNGWRKMDASETPEGCIAEGLEIKQNKKTGRWRVKDVDGPRYRALGNSKAVPVIRWLGERIDLVDKLIKAGG